MKPWPRRRLVFGAVLVSALWSAVQPAVACSVCFGDPDSPMAKGAVMGVLVLGGFIGFVLLGIAGTGLFWIHRSRKLARKERTQPSQGHS